MHLRRDRKAERWLADGGAHAVRSSSWGRAHLWSDVLVAMLGVQRVREGGSFSFATGLPLFSFGVQTTTRAHGRS